jgi:hypothetical protein
MVPEIFADSGKPKWEVGTSFYSENGKYGTDSYTTTTYIPFTLRRYFKVGDLELVVPFVASNTTGQVIIVGGVPNAGAGGSPVTREHHGGLGDMIVKGSYDLVDEAHLMPAIDAVGKVKFPTASRTNSLGTGEFDEGGSLEFTKSIGERYVALADVGYMLIGSPPGLDLHNQWHYSLGGGYYFLADKLFGSLSYEQSRALLDDDSDPKDLLLSADYYVTRRLRFGVGIMVGLSTSVGDFGMSFGSHLKF